MSSENEVNRVTKVVLFVKNFCFHRLRLYRYHNEFRRIEYSRQIVPHESSADDYGAVAEIIPAARIFRKEALVRCVQTVQYQRDPHLTSVSMTG